MSKEENFVLLIHSATGFMMFNDSAGIAILYTVTARLVAIVSLIEYRG